MQTSEENLITQWVPGNFVEYIIWHRLAEEWPYRCLTFICHGPSQLNFPFPVAFSGNNAVWKVSSVSNGIRVSCSSLGPDSSFRYAGHWWHTLNSRSQPVCSLCSQRPLCSLWLRLPRHVCEWCPFHFWDRDSSFRLLPAYNVCRYWFRLG